MNSSEIRKQFIDFFREKGHTFVPSSPVVPYDDPTLLFTNAGMNQFKDVFLGTGRRDYSRAVNSQKCIRAGGKHNDLDDVGHDTYHHTFFEMLGNWSFGDYFKREAIEWAWELLTKRWGLDKARLHATVFKGDAEQGLEPDEEAAELWRTMTDIDPRHIHYYGKKDNFWEMGDTGPCGPCSEIHIDLTPDKSGGKLVNAGDARVMEIWNLVFIQFNRDAGGKLTPLPAKHVDTGMGFERVTSVLQGKKSNYDTDIFAPIFEAIREATGAEKYTGLLESAEAERSAVSDQPSAISHQRSAVMKDVAYRVIADHIRCLTFALTDGATLSNEGRGYVLRRILRRAVRYGWQHLNVHEPFLHKLVPAVLSAMGDAFPELRRNPDRVAETIRYEEVSFEKTIEHGISVFDQFAMEGVARAIAKEHDWTYLAASATGFVNEFEEVPSPAIGRHWHITFRTPRGEQPVFLENLSRTETLRYTSVTPVISGHHAFKLHDTYGFPIDLTQLMASELEIDVDVAEYERLMEEAKARARVASKIKHPDLSVAITRHGTSNFVGYAALSEESTVRGLYVGPNLADSMDLKEGEEGAVVLDSTPFYAEQGGQVGDRGRIEGLDDGWLFIVSDTQKVNQTYVHFGGCERGRILPLNVSSYGFGPAAPPIVNYSLGRCRAIVEPTHREPTMKNHTSTHIMNWALREVLGGHVEQKGSLVDTEKTRFDFSHPKPLTPEEIKAVEDESNEQIRQDHLVYTAVVPQVEAVRINTLRAVFGEKYPAMVRVVSIGAPIEDMIRKPDDRKWMHYAVEFCGGTHLKRSSEAEVLRIIEETAVAKGVRRITAVTGERARACDRADAELRAKYEELARLADDRLVAELPEFLRRLNEADCTYLTRLQLRQQAAELQERVKKFEKQQAKSDAKDVRAAAEQLLARAVSAGGAKILVGQMPAASPEQIREALDYLRTQTGSAAICLGSVTSDKVLLFAAMTDDLVSRGLKAGDLIREIAPIVGGGGGGKPQLAQAGGKNPAELPKALEAAREWLIGKLS